MRRPRPAIGREPAWPRQAQRRISTVGEKWANFQTENFNASSQPWYVLVTPDERLLTPPVGYTPDADQFAEWLRCGLEAFASGKGK